jgi:hypothetical protein
MEERKGEMGGESTERQKGWKNSDVGRKEDTIRDEAE